MARPSLSQLRDARVRGALAVPVSQILLALAGYVLLALVARTLPPAGFATISAFYLLLNTIGRGLFASVELETSRALSAADALGRPGGPILTAAVRRSFLLLGISIVLALAATPLLPDVEVAIALAAGSCTIALSYVVRGPLAARRRFSAYSATFALESLFTLAGAVGLFLLRVESVEAWLAVLVISPGVAALLVVVRAVGHPLRSLLVAVAGTGPGSVVTGRPEIRTGALLWISLFYLSSQGVWNLAPVSVTAALDTAPVDAAGFVAVAVILRAPVFVFPAIQAVLLPAASAAAQLENPRGASAVLRPLFWALATFAVPWLVAAVVVVPWLARIAFSVDAIPSAPTLLALGASTVVGAVAFVVQTRVLAFSRHRDVGLAWFAGLGALGLCALLPGDARLTGAVAQLTAAIVVVIGVLYADHRIRRSSPAEG